MKHNCLSVNKFKTVICIYKTFVTTESVHVPHVPELQPNSIKETHQQIDHDNELDNKYTELEQTKLKIKELELKIQLLEDRIPKKYPDVTYLNYKNRKRILVRIPFRLLLNLFFLERVVYFQLVDLLNFLNLT